MNTFANRFKILRTELELSQEEVGNIFKKQKSSIGKYERGITFPNQVDLKAYAKFFNVSVDYLIGVSDIRNPISPDVKSFAQDLIDTMIAKGMITSKNNISC